MPIKNPAIKFFIGFVAGLCATFMPRLVAYLTIAQPGPELVLINKSYILVAIVFSAILGAVVLILEWGVAKEPKLTFMAALGLPALISGALNTTDGAIKIYTMAEKNAQLTQALSQSADIPVLPPQDIQGINTQGGRNSYFNIFGVSTAYAQDIRQQQEQFNPSIHVKQAGFLVVLDRADNMDDARKKVQQYKAIAPKAEVIKTTEGFLIISDRRAKAKSDALLDALQLKRAGGVNPQLLQVEQK